jgi:hypothetical protein
MIPEDVAKNQCQIITVDKLQELKPDIDVLLIENVELFEDLSFLDFQKVKFCLQKLQCPRVLITSLMTYRAYCALKEEIPYPFIGYELPGMKVEHLNITCSRDENKSLALKSFIKSAASYLQYDDKVLILTGSQNEANELYKFIAASAELTQLIKISCIHFGPTGNPP